MLLLIVLFAKGAAGITLSLSCFSKNYISLMLKVIPVFLLLDVLCNQCISHLFDFNNLLYRLTGVKGALGAAFRFVTLKYMRTSDEI